MAEGVGFEPTGLLHPHVFKTCPFGRSGIPPDAHCRASAVDCVAHQQCGRRAVGAVNSVAEAWRLPAAPPKRPRMSDCP